MALRATLLSLLYVLGPATSFIMPLTNTDGSPDIGNIINHLTLVEQKVLTLETKDHDRELMVNTLKTQQAHSQLKIRDLEASLKTQETSCNDKIHELETKLNHAETEIALLKTLTGSKPQPTHITPDIANVKTDIENLKQDVTRLQFNLSMSGGGMNNVPTILSEIAGLKQNFSTLQDVKTGRATFVRWGRTDCPAGNDVVYKGYMGGKHYQETGSGTNYLCLPDNPVYGPHHSQTNSRIYGVEYYADPTSTVKTYDDAPCIVCQSQTRSNSLMVPARNQCFSGWHLEYTGFIMAAEQGDQTTEYICVDQNPQAITGGQGRTGQGYVVAISSMCGTLQCPPYINGLVVPCAICTN